MSVAFHPNPAIIPTPKLEEDFYDWWQRHDAVLALHAGPAPEIVLIGDSITHLWPQNGPVSWRETFGGRAVANLGFGWDRTQNVLWRLDHGELDDWCPRLIVLNIGTNNFGATERSRFHTPAEVQEGILAILARLRQLTPGSLVIVMGVFPRGQQPDDFFRAPIAELNARLARRLADAPGVRFLEIGAALLEPDGTIAPETMPDFTHPSERGYTAWGRAMAPLLPP